MVHKVTKKVKDFIEEQGLIEKGDTLVVGVSGGADSMMLLHFLYTHQLYYDISLKIAHVHHGIREEAELDAKLVEEVCKEWGLAYFRKNCDVKATAKKQGLSEEEAGRKERYSFFISLLNPNDKIVTAHHMNDQAETLIMRFFRGTDLKGLGGILPKTPEMIRPLLCLERSEIEDYCQKQKVPFREDATNLLPIYTRNKIRLECIPYIQDTINPNIVRTLGEHSQLYRESETFLKEYTLERFKETVQIVDQALVFDLGLFSQEASYIQKRLVYLGIEKLVGSSKDITLKHIQSSIALTQQQTGKKVHLPYGIVVSRQYNRLMLTKKEGKKEHVSLNQALQLGVNQVEAFQIRITLTKVKKETIEQKNEKMYTKYIDYGKIKDSLQIRTRQPQDYIVTAGGTKKIKKLFIDDKVPNEKRDYTPLITQGQEVIWVVGGRLNTDYYITEATQEVLEIKLQMDES
ncbi:tRNA lysidine(34) synthetase TilS [Sporanaerobium hydrogeniformans]|uniref:tRNA lysidine(34) synthetase TilS n=1 Tax=Sporanaerobium hydrogeniformans TaxID=3072179 RepID=A0AC61DDC1_9FIRM|nr:tRNA lysidine(34) synthetase TilS [Sporanaerobium hydrogeniformans]PHV71214.1 tRNA lysidine(34) synthetase TilS [Sporanaerobium hydrogeniformans]